MEHYASTLATTAAAVVGLVAAAQILHPANFERPARAPRAVVAQAPAPAWTDPPVRSAAATVAPRPVAIAEMAVAETTPVETALPSPRALPVEAAARPVEGAPERARKAAAAQKRRSAARATHLRQATLAPPAAPTAPTEAPPARDTNRIDPICYLILGLGLGRDG